jgi:hypothetical protein
MTTTTKNKETKVKNFLRKLLGLKPKNELIKDIDKYVQSVARDPKTGKWIQDAEDILVAELPANLQPAAKKIEKVAEDFAKSKATAPKKPATPTAKKPTPKKPTSGK